MKLCYPTLLGLLSKQASLVTCRIEDDQYNLFIIEKRTNMPIYAIEYGNEE